MTAVFLTLVPAPLLEPRYFIIPFILLRLHISPGIGKGALWRLAAEGLVYIVANFWVVWMFVARPFKWPTEDGWQRFMW